MMKQLAMRNRLRILDSRKGNRVIQMDDQRAAKSYQPWCRTCSTRQYPRSKEIDVDGFNPLGGNHGWPLLTTPNQTFQWVDNVSYTRGKHTFRFGGEFRHGSTDNTRDRFGKGRIRFAGGELSCTTCHSMHAAPANDQLKPGMDGDAACLPCHAAQGRDVSAHTRHDAASEGSRRRCPVCGGAAVARRASRCRPPARTAAQTPN